jgi:hypothetical protein
VGGWVGGWVVGWGEIEIKAKLSPARAGAWAELGNNHFLSFLNSPRQDCPRGIQICV